jgi:hypothetical protein
VYLAVGLSITAGVSGGTMVSLLSRVIAARNVGQCWGAGGSSVFDFSFDGCRDDLGKDAFQLEAQGDAMIGSALVVVGAIGLLVTCAVHHKLKCTSWRLSMEELSLLSALTPLWVAALPIVIGGAVGTVAAPLSGEHPLARLCGSAAALVGTSFVLTALMLLLLVVIPVGVPTVLRIVCQPLPVPRPHDSASASLITRSVRWFWLIRQRLWHWEPTDKSMPSTHRIVLTLLVEYRALWYAAVDSMDVCIVAVLGDVGPLLRGAGVLGQGWLWWRYSLCSCSCALLVAR